MSGSVRLDADRDAVTEFEHVERIPRQRAAERLADIAYALTAGDALELRRAGEHATVAVADEVLMTRRSTSNGDQVEVVIELSWSSPGRVDPASRT